MKIKLLFFLFMMPYMIHAEGIDTKIDQSFKPVSDFFSQLVFFQILDIPFVLILLVFSALFFTLYFGFPNIRYFKIAVNVER